MGKTLSIANITLLFMESQPTVQDPDSYDKWNITLYSLAYLYLKQSMAHFVFCLSFTSTIGEKEKAENVGL